MKIKITRDTICDGKPVFKGDLVSASDKAARILIDLNKAEVYSKPSTRAPAKGKAK